MFNLLTISLFEFTVSQWVDFSISVLVLLSINLYVTWFVRRKMYAIPFYLVALFIVLNALLVGLTLLTILLILVYLILLIVFISLNQTELKAQVDSLLTFRKDFQRQTQYDKEMVYDILLESVSYLSKNRVGALITLERTANLNEYIQNGKMLNAPINADLMNSIFQTSSALHDGAIIIRGGFMLAASVYFTPTTKPMSGNFGSRHRAAIGISEITDAVTIVVSEQTGKISLTYGGKLTAVYLDNFKQMLANFMENRLNQ
jgi:uncharacterized protein (TIGR00159 family)